MLNRAIKIALTSAIIVALAGSAALQPKPQVPEYSPKFAYTPTPDPSDTTAAFGSVVVVDPTWGKDVPDSAKKSTNLSNFRNALSQGASSILLSKNISVKGPVGALEDMTFSEKKESHLALTTELQVGVSCDGQGRNSYSSRRYNYMDYDYTTDLKGYVLVKVLEPQSRELLWQKRIELPESPFKSTVRSTTDGNFCYGSLETWPVEHRNALYQSLESVYEEVLKKMDGALSKGEIASLSKQASEIKSKKVY